MPEWPWHTSARTADVHRRVVHRRMERIRLRVETVRHAHACEHALALARQPFDALESWTVLKAQAPQLSVRFVSAQPVRQWRVEHGAHLVRRREPHARRGVRAPGALWCIGPTAHLRRPVDTSSQQRLDSIRSFSRQDERSAKLDIEQLQRLGAERPRSGGDYHLHHGGSGSQKERPEGGGRESTRSPDHRWFAPRRASAGPGASTRCPRSGCSRAVDGGTVASALPTSIHILSCCHA